MTEKKETENKNEITADEGNSPNNEERAKTPQPSAAEDSEGGLRKAIREIVDPFKSLAHTSRALWAIYIAYILEGTVYFGILTILGKYLSENVGLSDLQAGWVYSIFTGGITLAMIFLGGIGDRIGVRKALLIALGLLVTGRFALAASGSFFPQGGGAVSLMFVVVMLGLLLVDIGYGMYQPASYSGVKQFTDKNSATMAYAMIYGLMNLGAFFSGILSPPVRQHFGITSVFWMYFLFTILAFVAILVILKPEIVKRDTLTDINEEEDNKEDKEEDNKEDKEEDNKEDKEEDNKENKEEEEEDNKAPSKSIFKIPAFYGMSLLFIVSLGTIIYLRVTAPAGPAVKPIDKAVSALSDAAKLTISDKSKTNAKTPKLEEILQKASAAVAEIKPPEDLPSYATVDKSVYELIKANINNEMSMLKTVIKIKQNPQNNTDSDLNKTKKENIIKISRALGVYYLAAAYSLVSTFDSHTYKQIRQRQSMPSEDMIPIPEFLDAKIKAVSDYSKDQLFRTMPADIKEAASKIRAISKGTGIDIILENEAEFIKKTGELYNGKPFSEGAKTFLVDRFYSKGIFLIKSVTPALSNKKIKPEQVPFAIVSSQFKTAASLGGSMKSAAADAIQIPVGKKITNFLYKYGIFIFLALLSVIFIIMILLKNKPEHPFHDSRFVFFIFILIPVQTLFAHNWLTLPYYINRTFGGTYVGNNFEFFSNINPILIFFLTPFVAALTARRKVYNMMIWGTLVMALPTFLLVLPASPTMLLTYILMMSVGEAMWQPRFLQWVAEIAPKGQTGAYMGIAQFPWFLTKVLTGLYSGYFLAKYIPKVGPQNPSIMWLIYAVTAMVTPLVLIGAKGWMSRKNEQKAEASA